MAEALRHGLRVRYAECDAQGVVFNAHYLAFFDMNITELWRAAFGSYQAMQAQGLDVVVAEAQLRFESPARFDDELTLEVAITRLGTSSIVSRHHVWRDGESLTHGILRHVLVDAQTLRKAAIPNWMRAALTPWIETAS